MSGAHGGLDVVVVTRSCLMSPVFTTVWNKSILAITEAHRISLQRLNLLKVHFYNSATNLEGILRSNANLCEYQLFWSCLSQNH